MTQSRSHTLSPLLPFTLVFMVGCAASGPVAEQNLTSDNGLPSADLKVLSKSKSKVKGEIELVQEKERLKIVAKFNGLKPMSQHGFHIHEKGDCSAPDAKSAGGHFAPDDNSHGAPSSATHHAGDLGNVTADKNGEVVYTSYFSHISLGEKKEAHNVLGKAFILHQYADDFTSQPSGAAGKRLACAVIPTSL